MYSLIVVLLATPLFILVLFVFFPFVLLYIVQIFYWGIVGIDIRAKLESERSENEPHA